MKKHIKKLFFVIVMALVLTGVTPDIPLQFTQQISTVEAAQKVKLNKSKVTLNKGKTYQLKISGTKKKVTWTSSNKKVATVSSKGKVTAKKAGTAKITAKVSGKKYTCTVTVQSPKLSETKLKLKVKATKTLKMTGVSGKVTWSSSNKKIATVSSKGKVTAKKAGKATITAKVGGKSYKCTVTVESSKPKAEFKVTDYSLRIKESGSKRIVITAAQVGQIHLEEDGDTSVVSWTWDDDWKGDTIGLTVIGKKAGMTTLVLTNSKNSQEIRIPVIVKAPEFSVGTTDISLKEGVQEGLSVTYAGEGSIYYDVEDSSIVSCAWTRKWSNNTTTLNITGKSPGTTTVKITNSLNDEELLVKVTVASLIHIKMPELPKIILNYGYNGRLQKSCEITNLRCEIEKVGSDYYYKIYYIGKKRLDFEGDSISSACEIGYKFYKDGMVVESGTEYSTAVCVGEMFGGSSNYIYGSFSEPGEYELVLLDTK